MTENRQVKRVRIAQVAQSYPPMISGAALVVQRLADEMAGRGHTLLVLAASDRDQSYACYENGVKVIRLPSRTNRMRAQQKFVLFSQRKVYSELINFRPDVIHTHEPLSMGVPALVYGQRNQVPVVFTVHALPEVVDLNVGILRPLRNWVRSICWVYGKWYAKRCSAVITPSRTVAALVEAKTQCPTTVISNAVDPNIFTPEPNEAGERLALCRRFGLQPDLPVILHVGRLDADKGVHTVVRAAARVLSLMPAQVLIVGDGTQRSRLRQQAAATGYGERFHFPGFVTKDSHLPGLYRLAAVFVTASEIETQGIVLLEAAASGLPIVAVRATCVHEIVNEGVNGYLVSPQDTEWMAEYVLHVLDNKDEARKMGAASRRLAVYQHSIENTIKKYEALCSRLAKMEARKTFRQSVSQQ